MENEIITKLKTALTEPIKKECQVVYIVAEMRKLSERTKNQDNFRIIKFYSDWCLHSEKTRTSAISFVLEKIEEAILGGTRDLDGIMAMVDFEEFQKEMRLFLEQFQINNPFIDDDYWRDFRKVLVDILVDCPLKPSSGEITEFRFTKSNDKDAVDYKVSFKNHFPISGSFSFLYPHEIIGQTIENS